MHNHGVRGNLPPFGSWTRFRSHEDNDLPVWVKDAGYYTTHIGKYLNGYEVGKGTGRSRSRRPGTSGTGRSPRKPSTSTTS